MLRYKLHYNPKSREPYHFTQVGRNGKVIMTAESRKTKQSVMRGIKSAASGNIFIIVNKLK